MSRYPRAARGATIKCIGCNAPATETVDGAYVCVECGQPVVDRRPSGRTVRTRRHGVVVRKTVRVSDAKVPHVAFAIESNRTTPARVRFADPLPAGLGPTDVTFRSDEDRTNWTRSSGAVEYGCVVDPDERVETTYLVPTGLDDPSPFTVEPEIRHVEEVQVHADATLGEERADGGDRTSAVEGRPDGGTVTTGALRPTGDRGDADPGLPAVGVVSSPEAVDAAIGCLARAVTRGHEVLLTYRGAPDHELLDVARGLGAAVVDPDPAGGPRQSIAEAGRELGVPGVVLVSDPTRPVDFARSVENARTGGFVVEAVARPDAVEATGAGVLVAIPAYNEAGTIDEVVRTAASVADGVLVVDDGSDDGTASLAEGAGASVVRHGRKLGYGAAIKTAFVEAQARGADRLVILDGDGQHDPADVPALLDALETEDADVVIGSRFAEGAEVDLPRYRRFGIGVINLLLNLSFGSLTPSSYISDTQSGFRAYGRDAIEVIAADPTISDDMDASVDILFRARWNGFRIEEVGTTVTYDVENPNSRNPLAHGLRVVRGIVGTVERDRPITTIGLPGLLSLSAGVGLVYSVLAAVAAGQSLVPAVVVAAVALTSIGLTACMAAAVLHAFNLNGVGERGHGSP